MHSPLIFCRSAPSGTPVSQLFSFLFLVQEFSRRTAWIIGISSSIESSSSIVNKGRIRLWRNYSLRSTVHWGLWKKIVMLRCAWNRYEELSCHSTTRTIIRILWLFEFRALCNFLNIFFSISTAKKIGRHGLENWKIVVRMLRVIWEFLNLWKFWYEPLGFCRFIGDSCVVTRYISRKAETRCEHKSDEFLERLRKIIILYGNDIFFNKKFLNFFKIIDNWILWSKSKFSRRCNKYAYTRQIGEIFFKHWKFTFQFWMWFYVIWFILMEISILSLFLTCNGYKNMKNIFSFDM